MNEYVLYQPCITSWSIVLFHPTHLSFSQRLINYGPDSVSNYDLIANQSTSRQGRTLLTVWTHAHTCTHTHTRAHRDNCVSNQQALFLSLWDHGKVFIHSSGVTLGMAVLVDLPSARWSRVKYLNSSQMDYRGIWYGQSWFREDYQGDVLSKMHPIFTTAIAALSSEDITFSCKPLFRYTYLYLSCDMYLSLVRMFCTFMFYCTV